MKWPTFGGKRRTRRGNSALSRQAAGLGTRPALEALEPRVLLSAVGLGDLPDLNTTVQINGATHYIVLPETTYQRSGPNVSGNVFFDVDGDGLWDPKEHALTGVKVFTDINNDGKQSEGESFTLTNNSGGFLLTDLPWGDYSVRAELPKGYKATRTGSDVSTVNVTSSRGVGGLAFALARTGFNVGVAFSEVSMPDAYKTGTTATIPVLVTNHGDVALSGKGVKVRIFLSSDQKRSGNDLRLKTVALGRGLEPGESVKLMLDVKFADALADFESYLIVDVVGRGVRGDLSRADNVVATADRVRFTASTKQPDLPPDEIDPAIKDWDVTTPYGGYNPGYGYTGTIDNAGGGTLGGGGVIMIGGGIDTRTRSVSGAPASVRGRVYHDRNASGHQNTNESGLSGITVYLDTDNNGRHDSGEPLTITGADGSYLFAGIPTEATVTEKYDQSTGTWSVTQTRNETKVYAVRAVAPQGWRVAEAMALSYPLPFSSGVNITGIDFGIYAPPQVGRVVVEDGYLAYGMPRTMSAEGVVDLDGTIDRVVFYYDGDADGRVDDILGVDSDGSDGYSIEAGAPAGALPTDFSRVYAVAQDNDGHVAGALTGTELRFMVEVAAGKGLSFREADGTVVNVTMTGPGTARFSLRGQAIQAWDTADAIELTGAATIHDIYLEDTTAASKLKIRTAGKGGMKTATMSGSMLGTTPLGVFSAPTLRVESGGIRMTGEGVIRSLAVASIEGITMPGKAFGNGVKIVAGDITGEVTLGSPLKLLNAGTLQSVDLTAPRAERIQVKGNYAGGSVTLTRASFGYGLNLLRVGRQMNGVDVRSASSIHTVRAGSMVRSTVAVGVRDSAFGTASPAGAFAFRGSLENLSVTGGVFHDSLVAAWAIGSVSLDTIRHGSTNNPFGLTYHHLGSYDGPKNIDMNVL